MCTTDIAVDLNARIRNILRVEGLPNGFISPAADPHRDIMLILDVCDERRVSFLLVFSACELESPGCFLIRRVDDGEGPLGVCM